MASALPTQGLGVCCLPKTSKWAQFFQLVLRFFFPSKRQNLFWKPQTWRDFLAPTEQQIQQISCLIITPRIHFAAPRISWIGVDLLKLLCFCFCFFLKGFVSQGLYLPWKTEDVVPPPLCGGVCVPMGWAVGSMPSGEKQMWGTSGLVSAVWDEGGSGSLIPREFISPLSGFLGTETPSFAFWECPWCQGSEALGWSCHLLAFARLGGGTQKSPSGWAASNQIIAPQAENHQQDRQIEGFNSSSFALIVEIEK